LTQHFLSSLLTSLAQLISVQIRIEDGHWLLLVGRLDSVVLDHAAVNPHIVTLHGDRGLGRLGFDHEVVVAVWTVLIGLFELLGVLPEALFALLACERHVEFLEEGVVFGLLVALDAVKPFSAYNYRKVGCRVSVGDLDREGGF
jgi:hypothetical protein